MVREHGRSRGFGSARSIETKTGALPEGRVRCPSCGGTAKVRKNGRLSKHNDRRGVECPHKTYGIEVHLTEIPPVQIPNAPQPPKRAPGQSATKDERRVAIGRCHECDRPVSGERQFCGPCLARRI